MADLQDFKEDIGLLTESGMIAIKQGDEESAKKLFNAIGILDPESTTKKMGYGLIALHKLEVKEAKKTFQEIYNGDPQNGRAQAFLAFAHMLALMEPGPEEAKLKDLKEGTKHAQEALEKAVDDSTKQLAQSILDWESELNKLENT
ncbi:MAG: hypothetical protein S4CHLAM45_11720 [Chlamydiales bacterium]|nr:hypothetical protein [Chlamydiales bacterium]MCH9619664.1 hypothetical protein [Chlamydiales bacterium]MCH9623270.1 hypothetical protein [Chlamydiales bacterium]